MNDIRRPWYKQKKWTSAQRRAIATMKSDAEKARAANQKLLIVIDDALFKGVETLDMLNAAGIDPKEVAFNITQ